MVMQCSMWKPHHQWRKSAPRLCVSHGHLRREIITGGAEKGYGMGAHKGLLWGSFPVASIKLLAIVALYDFCLGGTYGWWYASCSSCAHMKPKNGSEKPHE